MTNKSNYRAISTFSDFSKTFEKPIYTHIYWPLEPKFSKCPADFHKDNNTQHTLQKISET